MVIKANAMKNAEKNIWNVAEYQELFAIKLFAIAMLQ